MPLEYLGDTGSLTDCRFGIIVASYHRNITSKLLQGCLDTLASHEVAEENITVIWVPGAWEIPLAASLALSADLYDAVICLGCVIRGETSHDQHINSTISAELGRLAVKSRIPVTFGVLTCNTVEQAIARSGGDVGNKGVESAEAAIHMVRLGEQLL